MSEVLEFAEDLARRAGVLIAQARADRALDLSYKEGIELLTSADLQADQLIRGEIERTFPEHYILSEESSPDLTDSAQLRGPLWVIDPIDGTVNYAYNQQQVAVSIAFAKGDQVQVGVVHCPFVNETFTAPARCRCLAQRPRYPNQRVQRTIPRPDWHGLPVRSRGQSGAGGSLAPRARTLPRHPPCRLGRH